MALAGDGVHQPQEAKEEEELQELGHHYPEIMQGELRAHRSLGLLVCRMGISKRRAFYGLASYSLSVQSQEGCELISQVIFVAGGS